SVFLFSHPSTSAIYTLSLHDALPIFDARDQERERQRQRRFVEALTAFGAVLALIGFVQKSLSSRFLYGFWELEIGRTPFGPFVNRNHIAGWMVMALPLALALLVAGIDRSMQKLKTGWRYKVLWFASPEAN